VTRPGQHRKVLAEPHHAEMEREMSNNDQRRMLADCTKQVHDKLGLWFKDTADLFQMADLSDAEMLSTVIAELTHLTAKIIGRFAPNMPSDEFGEYMAGALREYKAEAKRKQAER
jgi:hypothetical protein